MLSDRWKLAMKLLLLNTRDCRWILEKELEKWNKYF